MDLQNKAHSGRLGLSLFISIFWCWLALGYQPYQPVYGDPMFDPWRWRVFPEVSGMGLRCMAEDKDGVMWFGVAEGVMRYDGLQWTSYAANEGLEGTVETLCAGSDGSIYAGGRWGIRRLMSGQWKPVIPAAGQSFGAVRRIMIARDGALWAATSWGALRCRDSQRVLYTGTEGASQMRTNPLAPSIRVELLPEPLLKKPRGNDRAGNRSDFSEVYEDREGRVWLGTDSGEILCFNPASAASSTNATQARPGGEWALYNETEGLVTYRQPRILELTNGVLWVVFYGSFGRANQFDGVSWKNIRLADFGAPDDCSSLLQTKDGVFWIGGNGAICANRDGRWQVYEAPKVPVPTVRTLLLQTSDGALWVGGQDADVLRLDYQTTRWATYQQLNFQWESPQGAQWFLHRDNRVVVHEGDRWRSYGAEDGLIDAPTALLGAGNGDIWVVGSHERVAATARFDGQQWTRFIHDQLSWGVDWRAAFESSDGSLWFGAAVDSTKLGRNYLDGMMQYRQGQWVHHRVSSSTFFGSTGTNIDDSFNALPDPIGKFYGVGETRDGRIWAGQQQVTYYDGKRWQILPQTNGLRIGIVEGMCTTRGGDLWVGSRQYGVFRYDGQSWTRFHVKDGLVANTIRSITQTADGSIWVATDRGISRYDGRSWTADVLPSALNMSREGGSLKASPSGSLWINHCSRSWNRRAWPKSPPLDTTAVDYWAVCYQLDRHAPVTSITLGPKKVSQPGHVTINWSGTDRWKETKDSRLQFSYRLDDAPWSPYTTEKTHSYLALPSGPHHFEVRARDQDFNIDPHPAMLDFKVVPPVWQQAWFIGLMTLLTGAVVTQTVRVLRHRRHLHRTNLALAAEVEERKRMQLAMEKAHQELLLASRQAGMAEVAANVLHNVGNVLNSVNVSAGLLADKIRRFTVTELPKVAKLLVKHAQEPNFLTAHEKGKRIPDYLQRLADHLAQEQQAALTEIRLVQQNIDHINHIIAMQQQYSRFADYPEPAKVTELVEDALRLNIGHLARQNIQLVRDFQEDGTVVVEKHRVLQVLVNLIRNAKFACLESGRADQRLTIRTAQRGADRVQIQVIDNGVGIAPENRPKIFTQGFTTRKEGHGFGLHSSAIAAAELGGSLTVHSDGPGTGACFTLEFPVNKAQGNAGG
jgi:signal transduction histidine kinase/ligand-binding sensor domain-containing protein